MRAADARLTTKIAWGARTARRPQGVQMCRPTAARLSARRHAGASRPARQVAGHERGVDEGARRDADRHGGHVEGPASARTATIEVTPAAT